MIRKLAGHASRVLFLLLAAGLAAATLVRFAPGFGVDDRELDARLSEESLAAIRASRAEHSGLLDFYARYLGGLLRGDFGDSHALNRPIRELIAERAPVTLRSVGVGLAGGWVAGLALAVVSVLVRRPWCDLMATLFSGAFLCLPAAVLALLFLFLGAPPQWAIALVVFPRVFRYAQNLLADTYRLPHVVMAAAKGLSKSRILAAHVMPSAGPQLLALGGVSLSIAFGSAIPIEAICDSPGIGQLAWQAAQGRDLPLLVTLTLLVMLATVIANALADLARGAPEVARG